MLGTHRENPAFKNSDRCGNDNNNNNNYRNHQNVVDNSSGHRCIRSD